MTRILLSEPNLSRFYSFCVVDLDTGCWNWNGSTDEHGYGRFMLDGRAWEAYAVSYNHFVGEVPKGLDLGHTKRPNGTYCTCAFWEHVRPVTRSINVLEGLGTVDRCKHGHLRTAANTMTKTDGSRICRVCHYIRIYKRIGVNYCTDCGYAQRNCKCNQGGGAQ